jgi:hypothetical protein
LRLSNPFQTVAQEGASGKNRSVGTAYYL